MLNLIDMDAYLPMSWLNDGKQTPLSILYRDTINSSSYMTYDPDRDERIVQDLRNYLREFPGLLEDVSNIFAEIYDYPSGLDNHGLLYYYCEFLRIREIMNEIVLSTGACFKIPDEMRTLNSLLDELRFKVSPWVDVDGKISFQKDILMSALEGIDIHRLRFCRSCKSVFWASRLDKVECSTKCRVEHFRNKDTKRFSSRVEETNKRIARLSMTE